MSSFKETRKRGAFNLVHPELCEKMFPGYYRHDVLREHLDSATKWASEGFPTFVLDGKRAAAFSATSCSRELLNWMISPFEVFGILTEPGLFIREDGQDSGFYLVRFIKEEDGTPFFFVASFVGDRCFGERVSFPALLDFELGDGGLNYIDEEGFEESVPSEDSRTGVLIRRLIVGLCLSLDRIQAVPNFQDVKRQLHLSKENQKLPGYIEYKFTKPVDIDIRKEVREYSKSGGGALLVRTLVRGYWRLAACGKDRMERRPVHVMPYWRGPIDAPIALQCPKDDDNLPVAGPWENLCRG